MKKKICLVFAVLVIFICIPVCVKAESKGTKYLTLHKYDGSVYKKYSVGSNGIKLPPLKNADGYTFLGWDTRSGQTKNPKYQVGTVVKLKKNTHLYPVVFERSNEPNIHPNNLPGLMSGKFDRVVFVGDSRTFCLEQMLINEKGAVPDNVYFVAQNGAGLSWLKYTGENQLKKIIKKKTLRPTAVVFNLGINNLKHSSGSFTSCDRVASAYIRYLTNLAVTLKKNNCKLYFMSVNPVNSGMMKIRRDRKEEEIRLFNNRLKTELKGIYSYIDVYSYLMKTGYSTDGYMTQWDQDDGVHYSLKTYKRIYRYCMLKLFG